MLKFFTHYLYAYLQMYICHLTRYDTIRFQFNFTTDMFVISIVCSFVLESASKQNEYNSDSSSNFQHIL